MKMTKKDIELTPTEQSQNSLRCTKDRNIKVNSEHKRNCTKNNSVNRGRSKLLLNARGMLNSIYKKNHINVKFHLRQIPSMCLRKLTRNAAHRCTCF